MTSNSSSVSSTADVHGVLVRRLRGKLGPSDPNPTLHYLSSLRYDEDDWSSDNEIVWSTTLEERCPSVCSCNGLVYVDVNGKQMVICNPKTKEFKTLPPSPQPPPGPTATAYKVIGFGFDFESNDFKVVRCVTYIEQELEDGLFGRPVPVFVGILEQRVELYSLKSDSWKEFPYPDQFINTSFAGPHGAYVGGKYYWVARVYDDDDDDDDDDSYSPKLILHSFDFAAESLCAPINLPPLPTNSNRPDGRFYYRVVEYVGSLGVVCYELEGGTGKPKSFSLLLWKEKQQKWRREFCFCLSSVRRPLGFSKDGRYLFLEGEKEHDYYSAPHPACLFVYDFFSEELKKLDVYEEPGCMEIVSYV